eukprot:Gb_19313 [translate_table: standard]
MSEKIGAVDSGKLISHGVGRLEGKVAIITGGAGGIGEAAARLFVQNGAKVIIADMIDEVGKELCEALGPMATYVHCDVTEEEDVVAAVDLAVKLHGGLDIMYNNAGTMDKTVFKGVDNYDMEEFDRVMKVNLKGTMLGIKHAGRVMIPEKKGCIISTSSTAGLLGGFPNYGYSASKHAIIGLTKNGAAELGKYGIRVNCISPYGLVSRMTVELMKNGDSSSVTEEDKLNIERFAESVGNLKGSALKAGDIAEAALYLASDQSKYVSGHNLVVDGGFTVVNHSWGLYR